MLLLINMNIFYTMLNQLKQEVMFLWNTMLEDESVEMTFEIPDIPWRMSTLIKKWVHVCLLEIVRGRFTYSMFTSVMPKNIQRWSYIWSKALA